MCLRHAGAAPVAIQLTANGTVTSVAATAGAAASKTGTIVLQTIKAITVHSQLNVYGELVIMTGLAAGKRAVCWYALFLSWYPTCHQQLVVNHLQTVRNGVLVLWLGCIGGLASDC
jgi:hypothetical protein